MGFQPDNVNATEANPVRANAPGVPFGIAFMGTAWTEYKLTSYAYAYEQATHTRLMRLAYPAAIPSTQLKDVIGS
jgi:amidase